MEKTCTLETERSLYKFPLCDLGQSIQYLWTSSYLQTVLYLIGTGEKIALNKRSKVPSVASWHPIGIQ